MGSPGPASPADSEHRTLADEAETNASSDPESAMQLARLVIGRSNDPTALTVAYRALGVAERTLRNPDAMEAAFVSAVTTADRAGLVEEKAFGQVLLASAQYIRGRLDEALASLDAAIPQLTGERALLATIQLGIIKGMSGDFAGGLAVLDPLADEINTLPAVRQAAYHTNRGYNLLATNRTRAAIDAFDLALHLYDGEGEAHLAANTLFNMARGHAAAGDVVGAMRCFERIDRLDIGPMRGLDWSDRAIVLLSAGLLNEAEEAAEAARRAGAFDAGAAWLPVASMVHAQTLEAMDEPKRAIEPARAAADQFAAQGRENMANLALAIALRCRAVTEDATDLSAEAVELGDRLSAWGAEADALALDLAIARHSSVSDVARLHLRRAAESAADGVEELMLRHEADARLAMLDGEPDRFRSAVESGLDRLVEWKRSIGSSELQASAARRGVPLAMLDISDAIAVGDPDRALGAVERMRFMSLLSNAGTGQDQTLQGLLAEYRSLGGHIERGDWREDRVRIEREIRERARIVDRSSTGLALPDLEAALATLDGRTAVSFIDHDGTVLAVVTRPNGLSTLHQLGSVDAIQREVDSVRVAVTRLSSPIGSPASREAFAAVLEAASNSLSADLVESLGIPAASEVLVVPSRSLGDLPWAALPALRDRPFSITPSLRLWASLLGQSSPDTRSVSVGLDDPPTAIEEAKMVASLRQGEALIGDEADVATVLSVLDGVAVAHLACHGLFRADNPLMSSIQMADGPLTAYDLERLDAPPRLIVLSACEVAQSHRMSGDALLGMSATLMAAGTRSVIAATTVVADGAVPQFMEEFHRAHLAGREPSAALMSARGVFAENPEERAVAAAFVCLGV